MIEATRNGLRLRARARWQTIKKRTRAVESDKGFDYDLDRGQKSIKGVNGPPAA